MSESVKVRTPVALIVFNRPTRTRRVLERIAAARPDTLFVIADAPRDHVRDDFERCRSVRDQIASIDWCGDVRTIYADKNMGCRKRVSSGIAEVFRAVPEAIFLEDDCLPHPSFFRFCDELLERYRNDDRVMSISGANFQYGWRTGSSYFGSRFAHVWGWASWRRAWERYDESMCSWPAVKRSGDLPWLSLPGYREFWERIFDEVHEGKINSWAFQWTFAHMIHSGIALSPDANLVENIGFESDATNTVRVPSWFKQQAAGIEFPLRHPSTLGWRDDCDARTFLSNNRHRPPQLPFRLPRWLESLHKRLPGWSWRHRIGMRFGAGRPGEDMDLAPPES